MDPQRRSSPFALDRDPLPISLEQVDDSRCRVESLVCRLGDADEEKFKPSFPRAVFTHLLQEAIVVRPMRFQVEAEIEERLAQNAFCAEIEGHKQTADTPITVQERVDGFELNVEKPGLDKRRQARGILVNEAFELVQTGVQFPDRRGHEERITGPAAANPVLRAAELAWILGAATSAL